MNFSEKETQLLRELWMAGATVHTMRQALGNRSKSGIYGKAHRMGLPPRESVKEKPERVAFSELDTVRLPPLQRKTLAALLDAHPAGLTHKQLGDVLFSDNHYVADVKGRAFAVVEGLDLRLSRYGWHVSTTGDRKGVKLHPVKEMAL